MSSEEVPFKSIKITLSDEALNMLESLRIAGSFRSSSMTIEESIRAIYEISSDILTLYSMSVKKKELLPNTVMLEAFRRYMLKLSRFFVSQKTASSSSAGT